MVSEERSVEERIADVFSEVHQSAVERIMKETALQAVAKYHRRATKEASKYLGKEVLATIIDCIESKEREILDLSLGFRDATVQLFDAVIHYGGRITQPCLAKELVLKGTYLKCVEPEQKKILLFHKDHGEFSIKYREMAITKAMNR